MDDGIPNPEKTGRHPPFAAGNPGGPGRPKGSRNKLGEAFVQALHDDFNEHGVVAIQAMRTADPGGYVRVIASLLPKQMEIKEGAFDGLGDEELAAIVVAARSALSVAGGGGAGAGDEGEPESAEDLRPLH